MEIIGLCGGSGSGKGMVSSIFAERGFKHIDTDAVYHFLTSFPSPCLRELADAFGMQIIKNGKLDRKALGKIVFSEDATGEKRKTLNSISHRHILTRTRELIAKYETEGAIGVVVDAPLLFESSFDRICTSIVCVVADEKIRISRIMERDGITGQSAYLRIRTQLPDDYLIQRSDYCIENNGTVEELRDATLSVINKLINKKEEI